MERMTDLDGYKGAWIIPQRTICEVHREIYDLLIVGCSGRIDNETLAEMRRLIHEAFGMGISMADRLIEHHLHNWADYDVSNPEHTERFRKLREMRVEMMKSKTSGLDKK
jgi:hypothetical protein